MITPEVIAGLQYVCLSLLAMLVGAAVLTMLSPGTPSAGEGPLASPAAGLAATILPPALLVRGFAHAKSIFGEYDGPLGPALSSYVAYTPQGQALLLMVLPALLTTPTVLMLRRRAPPRVLAISILLLALPMLFGQASQGHVQILGGGSMGLWPMTARVATGTLADGLHLGAVMVWVGGLFHLASAGLRGEELPAGALRRFSNLALACVVVLIGSGLGTYHLHFRSRLIALFTEWGVVLLMKLAVLAPMLVLAVMNRRALSRGEPLPPRRLTAEMLLGMLALLLGSLLAQLDPHPLE